MAKYAEAQVKCQQNLHQTILDAPPETEEDFARMIKVLLNGGECGFNTTQLEKVLDVPKLQIRRWTNGHGLPPKRKWGGICDQILKFIEQELP